MKILIVESNSPERVAYSRTHLGETTAEQYGQCLTSLNNAMAFDIAEPYADGFNLNDIDFQCYRGVVFTGAGVSWGVDDARAAPLRTMMGRCFDEALPCFGSCNGMQLAAEVLGGSNGSNPNGLEIGFAKDIELTSAGQNHPMMAQKEQRFASLCVHRDHVITLPSGAILIAGNAHTPIQAFVYEQGDTKFWGTQYHPELEPKHIIDYITEPNSIFAEAAELVDALNTCEHQPSPKTLNTLGIKSSDTDRHHHTLELRNWLASL